MPITQNGDIAMENAAVTVQVVDQPSVPTAHSAPGRWRATEACPVCP